MVEFRDNLLTNNKVVVNCRTEEQLYNLKQWLNNKKSRKAYWSLQYWDSYTDYSGFDMVSYEEYSKVTGKTILTYEEALKPVDIEPKNDQMHCDFTFMAEAIEKGLIEQITKCNKMVDEKYEGTIITNYDANTGIEQIIKIPMDANLDEMAYIFSMFLKSVGYSPIAGVTIQREGMSDITSEDLYC